MQERDREKMPAPKASSTFEILSWPDEPPRPLPITPVRPQPTGGISSILEGAELTPEEAQALQNKKKPNSELKKKEMTGSGIFSLDADGANTPDKLAVRVHQPAGGVSHILFGEAEAISPRKPTSIPEVAKQRELSGTLEAPVEETPSRKPTSTSKVKELVGSDIFGPPPSVHHRSLFCHQQGSTDVAMPLQDLSLNPPMFGSTLAAFGIDNIDLSARKCNIHKVAELSGNNIFKEDTPPSLAERSQSAAKRKEINGNDIFADEKPVLREHFGGIRKPPGGGSSLALV